MRPKEMAALAILAMISGAIIAFSIWHNPQDPAPAPAPLREYGYAEDTPLFHIVQEGETLGEISQKYLATHRRWPEILEANKNLLSSPEELKPNMVLLIPRRALEDANGAP